MKMGIQNDSKKQLLIKEKNGDIEIGPLKTETCDDAKSVTVDYVISLFTCEAIDNISIDTSRIIILKLSQCNLTDLPEPCKKLNLKHLDLSRNYLTRLPACLYTGLKYLEFLDLSYNKIVNFDMEPECLPYLKVILLNNNNFENVPKWFLMFRSTNLEEFNYSHNKAKHYKYLKNSFNVNLIKLKKLELQNASLIDTDYNFLKCFKSLTYLDISNDREYCLNKFQDLDDLFVQPKWKELHVLRLQSLSLSLFPEGIAWIESLKELYLTNNCLSWIPDDVQFLVNLEILDISKNAIIAIPNNLVSLEKLAILRASDNSIESAPDFARMPNLKTLDLFNNLLEEFSCNLHNVDFVDVEDNYYDTKYIEDTSVYEEKKNRLRNKYSYMRCDGPKVFSNDSCGSSSHSSSDSEDDYRVEADLRTICSNQVIDETENWDLPVMTRPRNPEIDSIDENWQGWDKTFYSKDYSKKNRIYVSDEDWMFVDFEES